MNIIKKIRNKIGEVWAAASLIAYSLGHKYENGRLVGRQIAAIAIENLLTCSDRELPDCLENYQLLDALGYKKSPNPSIFSHVRKEIGAKAIMEVDQFIIQRLYRNRSIRLLAIDSKFIQTFSKNDAQALFGYFTTPKRDQTKEKKTETKQGYKIHAIIDVETGIPLYWIVLPANKHDSEAFDELFQYVKDHFRITHDAKFLADSAYDSTHIYEILRYFNVVPVIAINGRGHYKSAIPRDKEYGKRWAIERFFSKLQRKVGILNNRFMGIERVTFHLNSVLMGYLIRYIL